MTVFVVVSPVSCCNLVVVRYDEYSLGLMRPLCCDQPETLTQGYYPRVDSAVINAAPLVVESSVPW